LPQRGSRAQPTRARPNSSKIRIRRALGSLLTSLLQAAHLAQPPAVTATAQVLITLSEQISQLETPGEDTFSAAPPDAGIYLSQPGIGNVNDARGAR
jgi:hypothetical protein